MPPRTTARRTPRRDTQIAPEQRPSYGVAAIVSAVILALYIATLAPATAMWDTSEYIAAAKVLGIPHPPGNPFFVLIAHVFSILPLGGSAGMRINVLAALCSALSAGTWFLVVERVLSAWLPERWQQRTGAAAAALLGATAFTVWNQSVVNEKVYTVSLAFFAIVSWLTVLWCDNPEGRTADRLLVLIGFLIALGYTNHPAGFLVAPAVVAAVILRKWTTVMRWRLLLAIAGAFVLGLTPFLVEPIRAGHFPAINEGEATGCTTKFELSCTFDSTARSRLADNINRVQYGKPPLDDRQASFPAQVGMFWTYFRWQWLRDAYGQAPGLQGLLAGVYLLLGLAGGYAHWKRDRQSFWFFGPLMFTITLALIFYMNFKYGYSQALELGNSVPREVRDRDYFYLWGFSAWSVWAGLGIVLLWEQFAALLSPESSGDAMRIPRRSWLYTTPVFVLALIPLFTNWNAASRHGDTFTRDWAVDLLNSVEPYGVLITNGDNDTFPLWYAQEVEGVRKDVTVEVTSLLRTDWYVRQMIRRPIYPYDAAKGPAIYRGRDWPMPKTPPVDLTLQQADALPEVMSLPQAQLFKKDNIEAVIPAGDIFKDQIIVLRVIKDSYPTRPLYFTSGSYPRGLGLGRYVANQGLVSRLFPEPVTADNKRFAEIQGYGFFDVPRSDSLWKIYQAPAALIRRGEWVDRASSDIPLRYVITAALLSDLWKAKGDSAHSAQYMNEALEMARAARLEDVLGFAKAPPPRVAPGADAPKP